VPIEWNSNSISSRAMLESLVKMAESRRRYSNSCLLSKSDSKIRSRSKVVDVVNLTASHLQKAKHLRRAVLSARLSK